MGASAGQISQTHSYTLIATEIGALLRFDVDVYSFEVKSKGLQNRVKNMTAITALISSVNPTMLTQSDIRAIVSMSYSKSDPQKQREIFDCVHEAWSMDQRYASEGRRPTAAELQSFQMMNRDSAVDERVAAAMSRVESAASSFIAPDFITTKVEFERALQVAYPELAQSAGSVVETTSLKASFLPTYKPSSPALARNGVSRSNVKHEEIDDASSDNEEIHTVRSQMQSYTMNNEPVVVSGSHPVRMIFTFVRRNAVDQDWADMMMNTLKGYGVRGGITFVDFTNGIDGDAISILTYLPQRPDLFDRALGYLDRGVIPQIRRFENLMSNVSGIALEYKHPGGRPKSKNDSQNQNQNQGHKGQGDQTTAPNIVQFFDNEIINKTYDTISFLTEGDRVLLEVGPKSHGTLDGQVWSIQSEPAKIGTRQHRPIESFITQEVVESQYITFGVKMTLTKSEKKGYRLSFYHSHDHLYNINFSDTSKP